MEDEVNSYEVTVSVADRASYTVIVQAVTPGKAESRALMSQNRPSDFAPLTGELITFTTKEIDI